MPSILARHSYANGGCPRGGYGRLGHQWVSQWADCSSPVRIAFHPCSFIGRSVLAVCRVQGLYWHHSRHQVDMGSTLVHGSSRSLTGSPLAVQLSLCRGTAGHEAVVPCVTSDLRVLPLAHDYSVPHSTVSLSARTSILCSSAFHSQSMQTPPAAVGRMLGVPRWAHQCLKSQSAAQSMRAGVGWQVPGPVPLRPHYFQLVQLFGDHGMGVLCWSVWGRALPASEFALVASVAP